MAKILVADDNSNIQKMVGLALKDQGIDVVAVGNGEAAVRKIADIHPDLVLADVFMPVRNGYEVCRYVKEDPKFSHIPVILLVGAFDPLDEQEAQRSGADGVLKKPFVPPDPLISMVKSALARAGVAIGAAAHAEKPPEPVRPAAEMLTPSPKIASPAAHKIVEPESEPLDDFPTPPAQVKIAAGHEPVAFGSLLQTPDVEDDAAFMPKGREEIEERTWGTEETEEEVSEEEESPRGGWRKEGHEDAAEETKESPDWREAAFHGASPAGSLKWTPAVEEPALAETTDSPAVAVSTLEKSADALAPFSGDAWAAAMAAGVEEKLARAEEAVAERKEPEVVPEAQAVVEEAAAQVPEPVRAEEPVKPTEPSNGWYSITSSPWDAEAKKASLLAATWDTPVEELPAPAVIEQPAPMEPEPSVEEAMAQVEEAAPVAEEESPYAGSEPETVVGHHENFVEHESHTESSASAYVEAPIEVHSHHEAPAAKAEAEQPAGSRESSHAGETPAIAETQEEEAAPVPTTESKGWENTWEAGALPAEKFAEVGHEDVAQVVEESAPADEEEHIAAAETIEEPVPMFGQIAESVAAEEEEEKPDMDALVARVIDKMNPEVLKKMTHEFLRPVIAAIIQEELNSKKS